MSLNPTITLDLVDSDSMARVAGMAEASNRSFKPIYNGAGTFSLTVPIDSEAAYKVRNRKTGIFFTRNDQPIWSGAVTSINRHAKEGTVDIEAIGWLEELENRYVRKAEEAALDFIAGVTAGGQVTKELLAVVNAQTDGDSNVRPVRLTFGTVGDTQVRAVQYKQGDQVSSKVKAMIDIEDGFDISIDPLTKVISTRSASSFAVIPGLKFGYGVTPHNLDDVDESLDGTTIRNRINVVIANGTVCTADDPAAIEASGVMLEEWISAPDIVDPDIGFAYANAELVYKRYGTVIYKITPKQFGDLPRPYDDFQWGDQGTLSVDRGSLQVDELGVRVFSGTIGYSDNGDEIISELQLMAN